MYKKIGKTSTSMKYVIIVESPAKIKTIEKILKGIKSLEGNEYRVIASFGHVRDLQPKQLGIDIENNFAPTYIGKKKVLQSISTAVKAADHVLLASDPDREGEAISWHLRECLRLKRSKYDRISFTEISARALENALKSPRDIDINLVNAQQARRIIDRIIGFKLSPLLWKNIDNERTLSAGRVQSACLKLIIDRENAIKTHVTDAFWKISGNFSMMEGAILYKGNAQLKLTDIKEGRSILDGLEGNFTLTDIILKQATKSPPRPFTTSSLQQEAFSKYGFSISSTMKMAQDLYEAGHITYMRTDSTHMSQDATHMITAYISDTYGQEHVNSVVERKKTKNAQEAHEAIRPTQMVEVGTGAVAEGHRKLYTLIYKRAVASLMKAAVYDEIHVTIKDTTFTTANAYAFKGSRQFLKYPGWLIVYDQNENVTAKNNLQSMLERKNNSVSCSQLMCENEFTSPLARYNEGGLVKLLESEGIGRPSTYASVIKKCFDRHYIEISNVEGVKVEKRDLVWKNVSVTEKVTMVEINGDKKKVVPCETGIKINTYLMAHFPDMIDKTFTAQMEDNLDVIARGDMDWIEMLSSFWAPFNASLPRVTKAKANTHKTIGNYIVRKAKFGHVIENTTNKTFIDLEPFLHVTRKDVKDITEKDVALLVDMPHSLMQGFSLRYGRYGFFLTNDTTKQSYTIAPKFAKERLDDLDKLSKADVDRIVNMKNN